MSDIWCVTNRKLCPEDFLVRIERIAAARPAGILLREKDLTEEAYEQLAQQVTEICEGYQIPCIWHSFADAALRQGARAVHLPLPALRAATKEQKRQLAAIGSSCHSVEEALEAERLGCTYITAGHIFATDCKKGLPGRGPEFLREVCERVRIPVLAIGGIGPENICAVREAGAAGACVMSGLMQCVDAAAYLREMGGQPA